MWTEQSDRSFISSLLRQTMVFSRSDGMGFSRYSTFSSGAGLRTGGFRRRGGVMVYPPGLPNVLVEVPDERGRLGMVFGT